MSIYVLLLSFLFSVSTTVAQDAPERHAVTVNDYFSLKRVGSPRISPDGEWIAYTIGETNYEKDKSETRVWMVSATGGEAIPMTMKGSSAGSPRWSPDGKYLSFLAARNEGKTQVWVLDRRGGEAVQLTDVKQGVAGHEWSPDGERLLLTIKDPEPEKPDSLKDRPEPWVINRQQFKRDYSGYLDERRTHLWVYEVASKSLVQITSGPFDESQAVWSPDGTRVAFVSNRTDNPDGNSNTDIWIAPADTTDRGEAPLRVTTNPGPDRAPAWSPDGTEIAYVSSVEPKLLWYATNHLAVSSSDGGAPRLLTRSIDRNVSAPVFSADGASIYFVLEESAERHLARIGVDGRNLERPVDGPLSVRRAVKGKDDSFVLLISRLTQPGEVFRFAEGSLTQLTSTNRSLLDSLRLGGVRNIHFQSADGTEIEGFATFPPGYVTGVRYPTLLRIHGGPVAQYDHNFNYESQLFAANGYLVVNVNPRGSSGYGQDFSAAIYQAWGEKDFEDVMAGVDYAIAQGWADSERLGVGGWSYGGILTNYVITKTDRFKGAITGASEVLYRANYGHDHYQRDWEMELGLPWKNAALWEKLSPFNYVENIVTPTLIMGGEKDWNVPILNSEQLYQALKRLGRTTQLVVYPGEHHGFRTPTFIRDRFERYLAWYGQYVKGEEVTSQPPVPNGTPRN